MAYKDGYISFMVNLLQGRGIRINNWIIYAIVKLNHYTCTILMIKIMLIALLVIDFGAGKIYNHYGCDKYYYRKQ
jgi:hypothetical protein